MAFEGKGRNFGKFHYSVIDNALALMKPTALKVYIVLLRYADFRTGNARPTDPTIARKARIHRSSVPPARDRLRALGLIKAWKHLGRWHYHLLQDIVLDSTGIYPLGGTHVDNVRKTPRPYQKCTECGKFSSTGHSGHTCRKNSGGLLREKSGTVLEILRDKLEIPAGSASASSGAEASPASEAVNEDDWLLRGKVRLSSFYSHKFTLGATKEPSPKFIAWLGGDCGCTQEEIKSLLATEYPSFKMT